MSYENWITKQRATKYHQGIDLRDHVDPGDVYVDNFGRSWTIEECIIM